MIQPRGEPAPTGVDSIMDEAGAALAAVDRDPTSGRPAAERAARRAARARHAAAASVAERAWGHALLHAGDLDGAVRHLGRAAAWGTRAGSPRLAAEARHKLAFAVLQKGRPQAALREIDAALPDLDGAPAARARAQRAIVLHVMGRLDESLAEFDAALRVLRRDEDLLGVQRMLVNRALVHSDRHAFAAAARDLTEAEQLARALGRPLTIGLIANHWGLMETLRGDVPAALRHLERAERIIGAHGAQLGTLHQDRAELLLSVGLIAEARAAAARAVATFRRERRRLKVPEVQLLLAQADLLAGDPAAAARHAGAALRRFRAQDRPAWTELARLALLRARLAAGGRLPAAPVDAMVATLDAAGWPGAALDAAIVAARLAGGGPHLERAAAAARGRGPALVRARGWYARALRARAAGDRRALLAAARTGLRILDEHGAAMGATDLRVHAAAHRADLVALGLEAAFAAGHPPTLLEWSERARASRLLAAPVRPPDDPVLTELLARLRSVTRDLAEHPGAAAPLAARQAALERRIRDRSRQLGGQKRHDTTAAPHARPDGANPDGTAPEPDATRGAAIWADAAPSGWVPVQDAPARPVTAAEPDATLGGATDGGAATTMGAAPGGWGLIEDEPVRPVSAAELGGALGGWALVEYVRHAGALHAITVVEGRVRVRRLGGDDAGDLIERVGFAVRRAARRGGRTEAVAAAAALLADTAGRLDKLLLAPLSEVEGRPLVVVPTGVLHSLPWSLLPSCKGRPVTVAPSATLWRRARARSAPPGPGQEPVIAVAGPRLPAAGPEAEAVAAIHGGAALVGAGATVDAVRAALAGGGLVHLAAHGRLSAQNPLFSDIALVDGPLMVYDVERLPRVPHTLVLAACDGGRPVVRTGDELMGLGVAFLARGTAQLVASVLPVPDAATRPLMVAFHEGLAAGRSPAAALADAQLALERADPQAAAAVAGFVCIGAGVDPLVVPDPTDRSILSP